MLLGFLEVYELLKTRIEIFSAPHAQEIIVASRHIQVYGRVVRMN
jgi:hypothetical protein